MKKQRFLRVLLLIFVFSSFSAQSIPSSSKCSSLLDRVSSGKKAWIWWLLASGLFSYRYFKGSGEIVFDDSFEIYDLNGSHLLQGSSSSFGSHEAIIEKAPCDLSQQKGKIQLFGESHHQFDAEMIREKERVISVGGDFLHEGFEGRAGLVEGDILQGAYGLDDEVLLAMGTSYINLIVSAVEASGGSSKIKATQNLSYGNLQGRFESVFHSTQSIQSLDLKKIPKTIASLFIGIRDLQPKLFRIIGNLKNAQTPLDYSKYQIEFEGLQSQYANLFTEYKKLSVKDRIEFHKINLEAEMFRAENHLNPIIKKNVLQVKELLKSNQGTDKFLNVSSQNVFNGLIRDLRSRVFASRIVQKICESNGSEIKLSAWMGANHLDKVKEELQTLLGKEGASLLIEVKDLTSSP